MNDRSRAKTLKRRIEGYKNGSGQRKKAGKNRPKTNENREFLDGFGAKAERGGVKQCCTLDGVLFVGKGTKLPGTIPGIAVDDAGERAPQCSVESGWRHTLVIMQHTPGSADKLKKNRWNEVTAGRFSCFPMFRHAWR